MWDDEYISWLDLIIIWCKYQNITLIYMIIIYQLKIKSSLSNLPVVKQLVNYIPEIWNSKYLEPLSMLNNSAVTMPMSLQYLNLPPLTWWHWTQYLMGPKQLRKTCSFLDFGRNSLMQPPGFQSWIFSEIWAQLFASPVRSQAHRHDWKYSSNVIHLYTHMWYIYIYIWWSTELRIPNGSRYLVLSSYLAD